MEQQLLSSDYTATSGTLTIAAGSTTGTFNVPVLADTNYEGNETATITLSNASNATISDSTATLTITDDDTAPSMTIADVTTSNENAANATFTVTLSGTSTVEMQQLIMQHLMEQQQQDLITQQHLEH